jgi:hypothetical protein
MNYHEVSFIVPIFVATILVALVLVGAWLHAKSLRSETKVWESLVDDLRKTRDTPSFYNESKFGDMPLGQVSVRRYRELKKRSVQGRVRAAAEILEDEQKVNKFTLFLETTRGVFCRTLEPSATRLFNQDDDGFRLELHWNPILIGKDATILEACIVYDGQVMQHIDYMRDMRVKSGDTLNIKYTFKGGRIEV